jgi:hypothetical protein
LELTLVMHHQNLFLRVRRRCRWNRLKVFNVIAIGCSNHVQLQSCQSNFTNSTSTFISGRSDYCIYSSSWAYARFLLNSCCKLTCSIGPLEVLPCNQNWDHLIMRLQSLCLRIGRWWKKMYLSPVHLRSFFKYEWPQSTEIMSWDVTLSLILKHISVFFLIASITIFTNWLSRSSYSTYQVSWYNLSIYDCFFSWQAFSSANSRN